MYISFFTFLSVSRHISRPTVCVSHFTLFSVFLSYSRFYRVHFSFFTFLSISCHIPGPTVFVSHFPHFSVFSSEPEPTYTVCISRFLCFSVFLAIFHVLLCVFLIFHDFQFHRHTPGPTVCISHFPRFSKFLSNYRSYSVCVSVSTFSVSSPYSRSCSVYFSFFLF